MPSTLVWIPKTSSVAEIHQHFQKCLLERPRQLLHPKYLQECANQISSQWHLRTAYIIQYQDQRIQKIKPIDTPATTRAMRRLYDELATTESTCPICMDDIKIGQSVTTLPCKHKYHYPCIRIWIQKSLCCPYCRHDISS